MTKGSTLRIAPTSGGVSIWSAEIFGGSEPSRLREFLARAFAVDEVRAVELRRSKAFGRIQYTAGVDPAQVHRKLGRSLSAATPSLPASGETVRGIDPRLLFLDGPNRASIRVTRVGDALSTWRVRHAGEETLRVWHPSLRNRRDLVFRLEEELGSILGVRNFSASALTGGVSIRFDRRALTAARLAHELEKAWPRLLEGLDGPPSRTRLVASVGLLGLAFTGQYLVPPVRPFAIAGVALYSSPNVFNAVKDLVRGKVGLPAMYSTGLGFMLHSGRPFNAAAIAVLMQLWPALARGTIVRSQRKLFAEQRRRPSWARAALSSGIDVEVHVDGLRPGDRILVRSGEIVPVDGVIEEGRATLVAAPPFGGDRVEDRSQGDSVAAGSYVHEGTLTVRVERAGEDTSASYISSLLPHDVLPGLPCSLEAERIANRNAQPALAASALNFLLTRDLRASQVLLRPDYATGPRLSAQLSAFQAIAHGLQQGVLFRNPAGLDRLAAADVYIIDDSAGLEREPEKAAAGPSGQHKNDGAALERTTGSALATRGDPATRQLLAALQTLNPEARLVYLSKRPRAAVEAFADSLGFESYQAGLSPAAKLSFIRGLEGTTLWIGDGSRPDAREAIAASSVSISVAPAARLRDDAADILLPERRFAGVADAIAIGCAHAKRLAQDHRVIYTANLLGVTGAFVPRATSLHVGLLSNLGTGLVYVRHAWALNRLVARRNKARSQLTATPAL